MDPGGHEPSTIHPRYISNTVPLGSTQGLGFDVSSSHEPSQSGPNTCPNFSHGPAIALLV